MSSETGTDLDELFGGPPPGGRFQPDSRTGVKPWTLGQNMVAAMTLAGCWSERAVIASCKSLCQTFDRIPKPGKGTVWSQGKYATECCDLILHRVVTDIPRGVNCSGLKELVDEMWCGRRAGSPLSWAEQHSVWRPYYTNKNGQPRISVLDMLRLYDRSSIDLPLVEEVEAKIKEGIPLAHPYVTRPHPSDLSRGPEYEDLVERFLDKAATTGVRRRAWLALVTNIGEC